MAKKRTGGPAAPAGSRTKTRPEAALDFSVGTGRLVAKKGAKWGAGLAIAAAATAATGGAAAPFIIAGAIGQLIYDLTTTAVQVSVSAAEATYLINCQAAHNRLPVHSGLKPGDIVILKSFDSRRFYALGNPQAVYANPGEYFTKGVVGIYLGQEVDDAIAYLNETTQRVEMLSSVSREVHVAFRLRGEHWRSAAVEAAIETLGDKNETRSWSGFLTGQSAPPSMSNVQYVLNVLYRSASPSDLREVGEGFLDFFGDDDPYLALDMAPIELEQWLLHVSKLKFKGRGLYCVNSTMCANFYLLATGRTIGSDERTTVTEDILNYHSDQQVAKARKVAEAREAFVEWTKFQQYSSFWQEEQARFERGREQARQNARNSPFAGMKMSEFLRLEEKVRRDRFFGKDVRAEMARRAADNGGAGPA